MYLCFERHQCTIFSRKKAQGIIHHKSFRSWYATERRSMQAGIPFPELSIRDLVMKPHLASQYAPDHPYFATANQMASATAYPRFNPAPMPPTGAFVIPVWDAHAQITSLKQQIEDLEDDMNDNYTQMAALSERVSRPGRAAPSRGAAGFRPHTPQASQYVS